MEDYKLALKEIQKVSQDFKNTKAYKLLTNLIERNEPKKPKDKQLFIFEEGDPYLITGKCATCESDVFSHQNYCEHCSQTLNWKDEEYDPMPIHHDAYNF